MLVLQAVPGASWNILLGPHPDDRRVWESACRLQHQVCRHRLLSSIWDRRLSGPVLHDVLDDRLGAEELLRHGTQVRRIRHLGGARL